MATGNRDRESSWRGLSVEARASRHFEAIRRALGTLEGALLEVEEEMEILSREFRAALAPTSLVLFVKRRRDRRPSSLHWGRGFKFQMPDGTIRNYRKHLSGRLTSKWVFLIARRWSDREIYFDFDRRRLKLNRRHIKLARDLDLSRRSLKRLAGRAGGPSESHFPTSVTSEGDRVAWDASRHLAALQDEILRLVTEAQGHPILPYARIRASGSISMGWAVRTTIVKDGRPRMGRRHLSARLADALPKTIALPRRERQSLKALDRRMRSIRSKQAIYIRSLAQIKLRAAFQHVARNLRANNPLGIPGSPANCDSITSWFRTATD